MAGPRAPARSRPPAVAAESIATNAPRGDAHPPNNLGGDCLEVTFFIGPPPRARQVPLLPRADLENTPGPDRDVTSDTGERRDVTSPIEAGMGQGPRELEEVGGGAARTGPPLRALRGGVPAASLSRGCPDSRLPSFCRSTQPPRGCSFHPVPQTLEGFQWISFPGVPCLSPTCVW